MKTRVLILLLLASSFGAFAQGKVALQMDLPIVLGPPYWVLPQDVAFANQPVPNSGLPSGVRLVVGLYAGTSSTALSLAGTSILGGATGAPDGYFAVTHITLPFAGGSLAYFQVKVWDSRFASLEAQLAAGYAWDYIGSDNIFTMTPGTSIAYPPINGGGGSTWVAVGNEVPLEVTASPEPSVFVLSAISAATLLVRRRRSASSPY